MKLFEKNEVTFAVVLILIYVFGVSLMQRVSEMIGIEFLAETVFCILMSAVILVFIRKHGLMQYLGLQKPAVPASRMLFYIPLAVIGAAGVLFGSGMEYDVTGTILHTVMMICVGFLEEIIFRGFLFRGIARQNLTRAVVISSLTFGIGHIVNLLNGSNLLENGVQVIYAIAVGFMLVLIFLRTQSIIPCIVFHGFNNCMTAFSIGDALISRLGEQRAILVIALIKLAVAAGYLLFVSRMPKADAFQSDHA